MNERERFWAKVDVAGVQQCWRWTAARDPHGYGRFSVGGRSGGMVLAHRFSLSLVVDVPSDACVLHSCDNPPCVNPAHLSVGNHEQNMDQMARRLRQGRRKLDPDGVREIQRLRLGGRTHAAISESVGVSKSNVGYVLRGETWKAVARS
jgi:hypothetical protein